MEATEAVGKEMHKRLVTSTEDTTSQKLIDIRQRGWPKTQSSLHDPMPFMTQPLIDQARRTS